MTGGKGVKAKGKGKKGKDKKRADRFEPRSLPEDAVNGILLRFPIKSVLRFRCVSKKWRAQIDSPEFRKKHLSYLQARYDANDQFLVVNRNYSMMSDKFGCRMNVLSCYDDYKSLSELNSSCDLDINSFYFGSFSYSINGIVCVVREPGCDIYLCNPALREIRQLPEFPRFPARLGITDSYQDCALGIGFDDAADAYVVVQFVHDGPSGRGGDAADNLKCVEYHLKAQSWTTIQFPPAFVSTHASTLLERSSDKLNASFFSHGCIHWCMDWCHLILTLNTTTRSFQEIHFPNAWNDYGYEDYAHLLKLDSSSSIALVATCGRDLHLTDIWVMKEYGVADSWTRQYFINDYTIPGLLPPVPHIPRISGPLSFWRKDKIFLSLQWGKVICYDLGKSQLYEHPLRGECDPNRLAYPDMKTMDVLSGGRKKLLVYDAGKGIPYEPRGRVQCDLTSRLPHPGMTTLQVVTCCGSLVSVYQS